MTFALINQKIANCKKNFTIWQEPTYLKEETINRGVARGGAGGARAPPEFGRLVNPIQTRGADYAPHTTANHPRIQKAIYTSDKKGNDFLLAKSCTEVEKKIGGKTVRQAFLSFFFSSFCYWRRAIGGKTMLHVMA